MPGLSGIWHMPYVRIKIGGTAPEKNTGLHSPMTGLALQIIDAILLLLLLVTVHKVLVLV